MVEITIRCINCCEKIQLIKRDIGPKIIRCPYCGSENDYSINYLNNPLCPKCKQRKWTNWEHCLLCNVEAVDGNENTINFIHRNVSLMKLRAKEMIKENEKKEVNKNGHSI